MDGMASLPIRHREKTSNSPQCHLKIAVESRKEYLFAHQTAAGQAKGVSLVTTILYEVIQLQRSSEALKVSAGVEPP